LGNPICIYKPCKTIDVPLKLIIMGYTILVYDFGWMTLSQYNIQIILKWTKFKTLSLLWLHQELSIKQKTKQNIFFHIFISLNIISQGITITKPRCMSIVYEYSKINDVCKLK